MRPIIPLPLPDSAEPTDTVPWPDAGIQPIPDSSFPDDTGVVTAEQIEQLEEHFADKMHGAEELPPPFSISEEEKQRLLPTPDLQRAFDGITAATWPAEDAISHKKQIVSELRDRALIPDNILRLPTVYVGSNADLEYPLCLGCRNLIMVDPDSEALSIAQLTGRVRRATGQDPAVSAHGEMSFLFDFGGGPETVRVRIEHAWYNPGDSFAEERTPLFRPPNTIGLVLAYQISPTEVDADAVMERMVSGGVILSNQPIGSILGSMTEAEMQVFCYLEDPERRLALLVSKFADRGFRFVPLTRQRDLEYVFAVKERNTEAASAA